MMKQASAEVARIEVAGGIFNAIFVSGVMDSVSMKMSINRMNIKVIQARKVTEMVRENLGSDGTQQRVERGAETEAARTLE
jgi:hypothetical protein